MKQYFSQKSVHRLQKVLVLFLSFCAIWSLQQSNLSAFSEQEKQAVEDAKKLHSGGKYPKDLPRGQKPPRKTGCDNRDSKYGGPRVDCGGCGAPLAGRGCLDLSPWILLGLVFFLLILALLPSLRKFEFKSKEIEEAEVAPEIFGRKIAMHTCLEDFVGAEDWEGAMCFTLLEAMRLLGWKSNYAGQSQTPREVISKMLPEAEPSNVPLFRLLRLTENVRFGGDAATQESFFASREAFDAFRGLYSRPTTDPVSGSERHVTES